LPWEAVDWSLFDFVGVDHFRDARIKDRYVEMLEPLARYGKPVVVTEFGMRAYQGRRAPAPSGSESSTQGRSSCTNFPSWAGSSGPG
jgi:hypothetical protein